MTTLTSASRAASQQARTTILQKLRAVQPASPSAPDVARYFRERAMPDSASRTQRFIDHARSWHADVIETDATGWPAALAGVVRTHGLRTLLAGRGTAIADTLAATLPPALLHWYDDDLDVCKPALFDRTDAGITTVLAGVAETGSLLLQPDRNEPRTLSLVPALHIAVLHESRLHETLLDALHATQAPDQLPTNLVLVSGPSKTADIQRMLVYGVHGPKALVILLIRDAGTQVQP